MNKDNFVKNCHLLAKDAKLIEQGKNGELYIPLRFWSELSEILVDLGVQTILTKGQYHVKELDEEQEYE